MDRTDLDANSGSAGLKKPSSLTVPVNGQKLQVLRQLAGLTQEGLAEKSGYSDRLIRKAEASGPLRKSTIADLAAALSTGSQTVTGDDLVFSQELISLDIAAYLLHGSMSSEVSLGLIHPEFAIVVAGHELNIPFAGTHVGPAACESFRDQLKRSFGRVEYQPEQTRCFASAGGTCVQAVTHLHPPINSIGQLIATDIRWFLTGRFEASRLISFELHYDTGNICRLLGCF